MGHRRKIKIGFKITELDSARCDFNTKERPLFAAMEPQPTVWPGSCPVQQAQGGSHHPDEDRFIRIDIRIAFAIVGVHFAYAVHR